MKAYPTDSDGRFMDLRDYFAAKAMQSLIPLLANQLNIPNGDARRKEVSLLAYKQADAMMDAREPEDNSHEVIADALARLKEENNHNACGDPHCGICV